MIEWSGVGGSCLLLSSLVFSCLVFSHLSPYPTPARTHTLAHAHRTARPDTVHELTVGGVDHFSVCEGLGADWDGVLTAWLRGAVERARR